MTPFLLGPGEVRISSARASNGKWALVQQLTGEIHLYTVDGQFVRVLPRAIRSDTQPVFSRTSLDHIYTVDGISIWMDNLATDEASPVESFSQYIRLSAAHAEGDLTEDGWLSLCGVDANGDEHVFCYNLHTRATSEVRRLSEPIDGLKAAYGGWLLISSERGIQAYPRFGVSHFVAAANGHACAAVHQVRPVLLWCNSAEKGIENPAFFNAVEIVNIENPGDRKALKSFDWAYAMHISAGPDFAIVSVYDPTGNLPSQLWRAPFDGRAAELLHGWKAAYRGYESTPRASYGEGMVLWNVDDGAEVSVWGLKLEGTPVPAQVDPPLVAGSRVDYAPFVGKKYWEMWPRADGGLDIIEKLVAK